MENVTSQVQEIQTTKVGVIIKGYLDNLKVDYFPVNFSVDIGVAPGTDENPQSNNPYLKVSTDINTDIRWNISINATDMTDGTGHMIPVNKITFNYTCFTDGIQEDFSSLVNLSSNLQQLCTNTGLSYDGYVWIYFYLNVSAGQYNNTYYGDIWFYAHSFAAMEDHNNNTWYGPNNTTATVKKLIEVEWTLTPINFGIVNPNSQVNATKDQGWPTNITIGSKTNVPIDLYINGTDLSGPDVIDSHNISYSNATTESQWPSSIHLLENILPDNPTGGDFSNWGNIANNTDVFSYWNMTVPRVAGGPYSGDVVAKAVDAGYDPTP